MTDLDPAESETKDCDLCGRTEVPGVFARTFRRGLEQRTLCNNCLKECAVQYGVYEHNRLNTDREAVGEGDQ